MDRIINVKNLIQVFLIITLLAHLAGVCFANNKTILMFVSHENAYYSEYMVMYQALTAAGYTVDVRSASTMDASAYGGAINVLADALPGSNYTQFTIQFNNLFGSAWNALWNQTLAYIPTNGKVQDVLDMSTYQALVIVGGTGIKDYRVDGVYSSQGLDERIVSPTEIQSASLKLNELALDALLSGKPIMGQCHGASIPVFWRIPETWGSGEETLGYSLLKGSVATGFPEPETATVLSSFFVTYHANELVVIGSPHSSFQDNNYGLNKILTTRDWYPQTVAYATRVLLDIISPFSWNLFYPAILTK